MIHFEKKVLTHEETIAELEKKFNEYSFMKNFVTINDPLKDKPISRTLNRSKGAYWVNYNKQKCFIYGAEQSIMTSDEIGGSCKLITFFIGY